jgi:hypothetical protein
LLAQFGHPRGDLLVGEQDALDVIWLLHGPSAIPRRNASL